MAYLHSHWFDALEIIHTGVRLHCNRRGGGGGVATGEFAGGSTDPPEVNSIHEAVVEKVAHFGIFVKMKGFAKSGLVYSSQVCSIGLTSGYK